MEHNLPNALRRSDPGLGLTAASALHEVVSDSGV
jgi:hypothetical protein